MTGGKPLPLPPLGDTDAGNQRRCGVELEFAGLELGEVSRMVADELGGEVQEQSPAEHVVHGDPAGAWGIELDFRLLKEKEREAGEADEGLPRLLEDATLEVLRAGARQFVPVEIVSPPLPMDRLSDMEKLIVRLREAGAEGTRAGITHAFGLQLNPEMPSLAPRMITRYLRAYLCLEDWLIDRAGMDLTREFTRFATPFPRDYRQQVTAPDYAPDVPTIIDHYLADNPTRNRTLDVLPLFLHLDETRVRAVVEDPLVKARPALHYRLPNCEVDDPEWGLHVPWSGWLAVERLAADEASCDELCERLQVQLSRPLGGVFGSWIAEVSEWLGR